MPGDRWQKLAGLRAYLGFMWAHPGKTLLFMGGVVGRLFREFAVTMTVAILISVLASLYPVVTVALARIYLRERVTRVQEAGAVATLAGVVLVSAG